MVLRSSGKHFVHQHCNHCPTKSLSSKQTPSILRSFLAPLRRLNATEDECVKEEAEWPQMIKATNALGKTGEQRRKWSETMERAGSKHLMNYPACWANRLLQIERNSRHLNRATWNISSCSLSQLPIGTRRVMGGRRGGQKHSWPAIL